MHSGQISWCIGGTIGFWRISTSLSYHAICCIEVSAGEDCMMNRTCYSPSPYLFFSSIRHVCTTCKVAMHLTWHDEQRKTRNHEEITDPRVGRSTGDPKADICMFQVFLHASAGCRFPIAAVANVF